MGNPVVFQRGRSLSGVDRQKNQAIAFMGLVVALDVSYLLIAHDALGLKEEDQCWLSDILVDHNLLTTDLVGQVEIRGE